MIYDSENGTAFIILTGTVVFYSLVYCFARRVGRREQKEIQPMGGFPPQRKVTVWVCEACVMIYHNPLLVCPDCDGEMKERTFATSSQLNVYLIRTEIEQFRAVLQRRMPGMTITFDDAFYFHGFEHRNECTIFARCCEADPVTTTRPSPVDREQASARRLEFVRWMRENKGAFTEFPIGDY